jgi:hypothetical protein
MKNKKTNERMHLIPKRAAFPGQFIEKESVPNGANLRRVWDEQVWKQKNKQ